MRGVRDIELDDISVGLLGDLHALQEGRAYVFERAAARGLQQHLFETAGVEGFEAEVRAMLNLVEERLRDNPTMQDYSFGGDLFYLGAYHYSIRRMGDDVMDEVRRATRLSRYTGVCIFIEMDVDDLTKWPGLPTWYGVTSTDGVVWDKLDIAPEFFPME